MNIKCPSVQVFDNRNSSHCTLPKSYIRIEKRAEFGVHKPFSFALDFLKLHIFDNSKLRAGKNRFYAELLCDANYFNVCNTTIRFYVEELNLPGLCQTTEKF